jgi:class 3 adenylate cyclase
MAELPTAREGVLAALELAETVRTRVAHGGDRPALPVRIGLHLGEVATEGDGDRLGHDVNIAARIQQAAEPGEVLSSRPLADVAKGKVDAHFERVGADRLKNLSEPVEMFRVVASAPGKRTLSTPLIAGVAAAAALVIGGGGLLVVRNLQAEPATVAATESAPLSTAQSDSP